MFLYILKHHFFFLFILLEVVSFVLVVQNNYQRASFINTANRFTGSLFTSYNDITSYFHLKVENEQLMAENARLRGQLDESFRIADTNIFYNKDSLYRFVEATIISNSINNQKNYMLINKGRLDGIAPDMGVITSDGIAGTVIEVSDHYSRIMSVLHIQHKINARIKKNMHLGSVEWNGKNYRYGVLTDVPVHVNLSPGDSIVTSGNSLIFPEGILIGTISSDSESNIEAQGNFQSAPVTFSVDFNKLYHVYVIVNLMKEELDSLNIEEGGDE
ncbi:MAG TPA: rod shape-determining protein MreC [Bacteroidales bacterium]|nr:rod shape-determining protein MreC [Bacteroidales bacterium]HRX96184.1 rod shape-determining protein MreC [Bacteroidales bacterium]